MARYSEQHKTQTRARILDAADRVIKSHGMEAASVAAVMREAGLTVGGFYAHFPSKEALAQESLLHGLEASVQRMLAALEAIPDRGQRVRTLIRQYLAQVDNPSLATACPLTLLLPDVARGERDLQNAFAERTSALLDRIASHFPEIAGMSRREAALAVYTSCVGAVVLARTVPAPEARQRITGTTEKMLLRMLALEAPGPAR